MEWSKKTLIKLKGVLLNYRDDIEKGNWVPVITDAYLQGGAECVSALKEQVARAGFDKKVFNDAIEKIITDLLKAAMS